MRRKYKKKPTSFITAVQLDLDTQGFAYNKWGGQQLCKRGDWLVDNDGDKYTVSEEAFARTYEFVSPAFTQNRRRSGPRSRTSRASENQRR